MKSKHTPVQSVRVSTRNVSPRVYNVLQNSSSSDFTVSQGHEKWRQLKEFAHVYFIDRHIAFSIPFAELKTLTA